MKSNYEKILRSFTSVEPMKKGLLEPHFDGDCYYASCGHSLVWINKEVGELSFSENKDAPNFKSVITTKKTEFITFNVNEFRNLINEKVSLVKDSYECDECEGGGEVTCNYGHEHECNYCGGSGCIIKEPNKMVLDKDCLCEIYGVFIKLKYIDRMLSALELINISDFICEYKSESSNVFTAGKISFILMGTIKPDKYETLY